MARVEARGPMANGVICNQSSPLCLCSGFCRIVEIFSRRLQGKRPRKLCNINRLFSSCYHNNLNRICYNHVYKCVIILRLAVQERLTKQIALGISEALQPKGVAVVIEAA